MFWFEFEFNELFNGFMFQMNCGYVQLFSKKLNIFVYLIFYFDEEKKLKSSKKIKINHQQSKNTI